MFLQLLRFINQISLTLQRDPDTNHLLRLEFMPGHNTTNEYLYIPALDLHNQLTVPGKQACTSQPIKLIMNGSLLIGSRDATNTRIEQTLGENVCLLFGQDYQQ